MDEIDAALLEKLFFDGGEETGVGRAERRKRQTYSIGGLRRGETEQQGEEPVN